MALDPNHHAENPGCGCTAILASGLFVALIAALAMLLYVGYRWEQSRTQLDQQQRQAEERSARIDAMATRIDALKKEVQALRDMAAQQEEAFRVQQHLLNERNKEREAQIHALEAIRDDLQNKLRASQASLKDGRDPLAKPASDKPDKQSTPPKEP